MRYLGIVVGIGMLGFVAFKQFGGGKLPDSMAQAAAPEPELPPEPPVIEQEPPPVLSPAAIAKIRNATRDTDPSVRWEALQLLINARDPQADAILFDKLHRDTEKDIRLKVVGILGERSGPQVIGHLIRSLRDTEPEVRLAVLEALGRVGDPSVAPHVSQLMQDVDERVRLRALNTLNALQSRREEIAQQTRQKNDEAIRRYEEERQAYEEKLQRQKQQQQQ